MTVINRYSGKALSRVTGGCCGVLLCLLLCGCATPLARDQLQQKMLENPALRIVDVRSRDEYDSGHLPGAVHIPFYGIDSGLRELGVSKQEMVVLYCEHGPRAGIAGISLYFSGYEHFYSMTGHMKAWRAAGMPVEKGDR